MTVRAESLTLTEYVRTALRADILSGQIGHGQPLRLDALMQRFEVSRSVVREVLIGSIIVLAVASSSIGKAKG